MALASSGSAAATSSRSALPACRKSALSSRDDLAVQGQHRAAAVRGGDQGERVDLDQGGVLLDEHLPQLDHRLGGVGDQLGREVRLGQDRAGHRRVHPGAGVDRHLGQRLRTLHGQLLDLHAALGRGHRQERPVGRGRAGRRSSTPPGCRAPGSTSTRCTVWPLMSMPRIARAASAASSGVRATFTPPALPRPPTLTCALTTTTPPIRSAIALACSGGVGHLAEADRDTVRGEQLLGLVLEQIHGTLPYLSDRNCRSGREGRQVPA